MNDHLEQLNSKQTLSGISTPNSVGLPSDSENGTVYRRDGEELVPSLLREQLLRDNTFPASHSIVSPLSSPDVVTPGRIRSPVYFDNSTQNTFAERSQDIKLEDQESMWSIMSGTHQMPTSPPVSSMSTASHDHQSSRAFKFEFSESAPTTVDTATVGLSDIMNSDDSTQWGLMDTGTGVGTNQINSINNLSFTKFGSDITGLVSNNNTGRHIKREDSSASPPVDMSG